ncbi:L-2-hydroxyglutarate oxidase [Dyadobacter chenwenxiniae]|uniref:L-2-hydroxyglutarate oxidase n=1 Tax=Dyadobacter chenwenxiniae TaxID=2906456 RepID=A0A9X1TGB9_9BACT|nr:L-2-hydroxyglutarate oxidase [Dyadobacter chenwenxiniae]MCF0065366.1 L-2-hydroxyglutarate oxidase [Dyadobacter chenwenxiniae]UON82222.1 L-2-hydroxyglutarate oxidase [Dyadobacter chenwenxiniae]
MYDITIVGGGIVGLATALRLKEQKASLKILLLEKENEVAKHQTGHNSGVIHSGLYYKPGSLKATNCIRGYQMLIDFCNREGVHYDLCGKIVVATSENQSPLLRNLFERGNQNGLIKNRMLSQGEIREIEPHVAGLEGIWVPYTGIIDYKTVSEKYAECFQKLGGKIQFGEKVIDIRNRNSHSEVVSATGKIFETKLIVNCAGLYSDKVAQLTQPENIKVRIIPFRGEYYKIKPEKHHLVKNLIYPVPDPNFPFLGVHFTRMIEGGIEAGPNAVFAFRREGYDKLDFNASELMESLAWPGFRKVAMKYWRTGMGEYYRSFSKAAFTKALQGLIPEIQSDDLIPGGAGVRAQACDYDGGLLDDFSIIENKHAINVCNAPSPAATSSLSIGQTISERVLARM